MPSQHHQTDTGSPAPRSPGQRILWGLIFALAALCGVGLVVITARLFGEIVLG